MTEPVSLRNRLLATIASIEEKLSALHASIDANSTGPESELAKLAWICLEETVKLTNQDIRLCYKRGGKRAIKKEQEALNGKKVRVRGPISAKLHDPKARRKDGKPSLREQARQCYVRNRHLDRDAMRELIVQEVGCKMVSACMWETFFWKHMEPAPDSPKE